MQVCQSQAQIVRLEQSLRPNGAETSTVVATRIKRLHGVLDWNIQTDYDHRLTEAHKNLQALNHDVEQLQRQYDSFVRIRQAATQSYQGYDKSIRRQRSRITESQKQVKKLMARQGHLLEVMAVSELSKRRERLEEFQVKARFAMADSYDRATRDQEQKRVEE